MSSSSQTELRERDQQTRIDEYVKQVAEAAPELDAATHDRLALLLQCIQPDGSDRRPSAVVR